MSDLIDRQAAIDAVWDGTNMDIYTREVKEILEELPTADLSEYCDKLWKTAYERGKAEAHPKKGRWIEHNPHKWGLGIVFECSECGEKVDCETCNYCPNCGARMEN